MFLRAKAFLNRRSCEIYSKIKKHSFDDFLSINRKSEIAFAKSDYHISANNNSDSLQK